MTPDEVTAQIVDAWAEVEAESEPAEETEVEEPETEEAEQPEQAEPETEESETEEADEKEAEEGESEEAEESEEGEQGEGEEEPAPGEFTDVEIQAFLAKYNGDVEKALKSASEMQRLIGRRDDERTQLAQRVEQLEAALVQARTFSGSGFLSEDQRAWVENAVESANPGAFVQQAMAAGEFDLARAVCREWAQHDPFEATRIGQFVDATEFQVRTQEARPEPVPPVATWQALAENYPELRTYEQEMVTTLERLGPEHPLVQEARSTDPAQAVRGIFGIYEIAKASTFALTETRNGLKQKRRKEADDAADAAVVTSATNTASAGETPRQRRLMPGLSEDQFEAAFAER